MKVVLIPCAPTEWRQEGRLLGRVELSPDETAPASCSAWVERLRPLRIERIYHSPDELASRTAAMVGDRLNVPTKPLEGLEEVDLGLWSGLTEEQLERRFSSAYHELCDAPLNVCPPAGEDLAAASERLRTCLKKKLKKNGLAAVGLVLRPMTLALVRSVLEDGSSSGIWETAQKCAEPIVIDPNGVFSQK